MDHHTLNLVFSRVMTRDDRDGDDRDGDDVDRGYESRGYDVDSINGGNLLNFRLLQG